MTNTIRGIDVKLGAETSGLKKALKDVDKKSKGIGTELRKVERLLKFNPKDTELLAQKQQLLSDRVGNTSEKLKRLKKAQSQVKEQFEKGEIDEGQYRAFQREVVETESKLDHFEKQLNENTSAAERFKKKMKKLGGKLKSAGQKMKNTGQSLSTSLTPAIAAAGAGMFALANRTATAGDQVQKMAQRTGFSTEALSELKHAAELSGTSIDSMEKGVKRMQKRIFEAEKGLSSATDAFDALGVSSKELQGLSPEEQFDKLAMSLADVESDSRRAALAQEVFGRAGTQMLPMLSKGSEGLADMRQEARDLGIVFDQDSADAAAKFKDDMLRLKQTFAGVFREVGEKLIPVFSNDLVPIIKQTILPAVQDLVDKIAGLVEWFGDLSPAAQKISLALAGIGIAIGPVLMLAGSLTSAIGALMPVFATISTFISTTLVPAIAGISAPVIGTVGAIAALGAIAYEVYRNWDEVKSSLMAVWELLKTSTKQLGISVAIAFQEMKKTVLTSINAMIEKLGVLEKLPFGIGDKFKGLKDSIADSAGKSADKIKELKKSAEKNGKKLATAVDGTKVAFGDMGKAVKKDIAGVIGAVTGQTETVEAESKKQSEVVEESQENQTDVIKKENENRTEAVEKEEENQTETVKKESEKRVNTQEDALKTRYAAVQKKYDKENKLREEFEQSWSEKIRDETESRLDALDREKKDALANAEELGADKTDIIEYYKVKRQKVLDAEAEEEEKRQQQRLKTIDKFEQDWSKNVFNQTATRIEQLKKEKKQAIAEAEKLGADKTDIIKYYNNEIQKVEDNRRRKEEQARQQEIQKEKRAAKKKKQVRLNFEQKWKDKLFQLTSSKEQRLDIEKKRALQRAETLGADKQAILDYYAQKEQELMNKQSTFYKDYGSTVDTIIGTWKDTVVDYMSELAENTEQASQSAADAIVGFADSVTSSKKTFGEALKDMALQMVTMLEQQVIAQQIAGVATAWAQAPMTFGASLAWIPQIVAAVAPALAVFESVKAAIRGFADGGLVTGPTLGMIGEAGDDEAVLPLNSQVFSQLAEGITAKMGSSGKPVELDVTINQNINNRNDANRAGDSVINKLGNKLDNRGVVLANR
ncbi:MAG: hypothetical protein K9L56_15530 [Clostridiales bacterium]|nr:hypothetical protein [Clostridiales bacterium]